MIGVILWSDPADKKAVIWCEDQGDLAYLPSTKSAVDMDTFFDVGDVVEFEVCTTRNMRLAANAVRIQQNWGVSLNEALSAITAQSFHTLSQSAKVIPLHAEPAARAVPRSIESQRRHG